MSIYTRPYVIAVVAQKGGTGKTTTSAHLATEASRSHAVALIDTDPQGSLSYWFNRRESVTPYFCACSVPQLRSTIDGLAGIDLVIIDTAGTVNETTEQVTKCADLVLIPTGPGIMDLETLNNNLPGHVILNMADRREIQTRQAMDLLQTSSISVTPYLSRLKDYRVAMNDGRTAQELMPGGRAALEVEELWKYVDAELRKIRP